MKAPNKEIRSPQCWGLQPLGKNLHMSLCFSPVGDAMRNRARKFPALVNCTWDHRWDGDGYRCWWKKTPGSYGFVIWLVVWDILYFSICIHMLGIIIPIDFHIFQRGWNHQPVMNICMIMKYNIMIHLYMMTYLWAFIRYNWLFQWDYTFYKWGFVSC